MIVSRLRDVGEFRELYESRQMPSQYDFDWLVNNPNLFCFYDVFSGKLRGYITIQIENGVHTLSGASVRKNFKENVEAVVSVCEQFEQDMYSYTEKKAAALVLKKAGFKKIGNNLYMRCKNG